MLVLGTANRHKGIELADLLRPAGVELRTLADFPGSIEVVEDGDTFAANARLKAAGYARHLGRWVLADDSGIAVDALDGRPGVLSARYSGPACHRRVEQSSAPGTIGAKLPLEQRAARFICHIAIADPAGQIQAESEAACRGRILFEPRGQEGFGYDPLFEIVEYHRSFGELGLRVKAHLSHRARAATRLIPDLIRLADSGVLD